VTTEAVARPASHAPARPKPTPPRARLYPYLVISPTLLVLCALALYPIGSLLWLSLHRNELTSPLSHPFLGLQNYVGVVTSYFFVSTLGVTITYTALVVATLLPFGLGAALLLNTRTPTAAILRSVVLLPWAVPVVVSGIIWKYIFDGNFGLLNGLLYSLGLISSYQSWLADPVSARLALVTAHVWKVGPFVTIMLLASLQLIPSSLYDAIRVDGGGPWQYFRHVVLPYLRPTLTVLLIFETMVAFIMFDLIYVMTGGGPANATTLLSWFVYAEIFKFLDLGKGAAMAFIVALFVLVISIVYLKVLPSDDAV
jgi:multiple sugar transport system permease protein